LHAATESSREAVCSAYYDTAALRFLYEPSALAEAAANAGGERLLYGSDFPLIGQAAALADVRAAGLDDDTLRAVLGENGRRLLGLQPST
jgi:predicted TIM-barrel fold metal-dependent hydrolase